MNIRSNPHIIIIKYKGRDGLHFHNQIIEDIRVKDSVNVLCATLRHSLIFHEDKVESAVEKCVDEVGEAEVEDEQVGDGPHPSVVCNI